MDPDAIELRVLGCLIEKQRTTPDVYPLTINAVRTAANQATNRDPVMTLDEQTVRDALQRLNHRRWSRLASGARTGKYRQLLDEALDIDQGQLAVLAVLMLRGGQTLREVTTRTARLHEFAGDDEVQATLVALADRGFVVRVSRRRGEREERWEQRLGEAAGVAAQARNGEPEPAPPAPPDEAGEAGEAGDERLAAIERDLAELRAAVIELRAALGA